MTGTAKGQAGFSLLETLLGLTLTAIIGNAELTSPGYSSPLKQFDGVHMDQAAVNDAILFGIGDHHLRLRDGHALRVQDLVGLAVRETNDEGLEWFTSNELANRLHRHGDLLLK